MSTSRKTNLIQKQSSNRCLSSTALEVVLDEQFMSDSNDDESNNFARSSKSNNTDDETTNYHRTKSNGFRNPKSHRLIEKRRRDRLNQSLADLLDLIPHKKPENQRRIEKIEIIDMAIKQMRNLINLNAKFHPDEISRSSLEIYRHGYQHGTFDTYEFVEKYSNNDRLQNNLFDYIKQRETEMKTWTTIPEKSTNTIQSKASTPEQISSTQCESSEQRNSAQVPSFVLHPSGTHYIPVYLDASIVSNTFHRPTNGKSSTADPLQCHPISIPVNFHFNPSSADTYELDIQNINVIGSRHETSVQPR